MLQIKVTTNPGKMLPDHFAHIQKSSGSLEAGDECSILFKNQPWATGTIAAIETINFQNITDAHAFQIIGFPAHYLKKILTSYYKDVLPETKFDFMIIHQAARQVDYQGAVLHEYWNDQYQRHANQSQRQLEAQ